MTVGSTKEGLIKDHISAVASVWESVRLMLRVGLSEATDVRASG